jgi:hypothetical protein
MRVMTRASLPFALLLASACAAHGAAPATPTTPTEAAPAAPAAELPAGLAPAKPLLGDWKREGGGEVHYVFAGDAIFGVSFTGGESFEVSITTAEPALKTRVYKDGASETSSDGAPSNEGLAPGTNTRSEDIERSERAFAEATASRGIGGWVDWFDAKGAEWDPGDDKTPAHRVEGAAAIKEFMGPVFARPNFRLEWRPITSGLAPGGALGYTVGTWEGVNLGENGARTVRGHGAFVTVWKRQGDGSWKVLFDTGDPAS